MEQKTVRHEKDKPKKICPVPNCNRAFVPKVGNLPFCTYHHQLAMDMAWIGANVNISVGPPQPKSGLIVAGSREAQQIMRKRRV